MRDTNTLIIKDPPCHPLKNPLALPLSAVQHSLLLHTTIRTNLPVANVGIMDKCFVTMAPKSGHPLLSLCLAGL